MKKTTICKDCGKDTPAKRFATYRTRKGELRRRCVCLDCRGKYQRENRERMEQYRRDYYKKNKSKKQKKDALRREKARQYVNSIKDVPCADCGQRWPPVAMDFDHVHGPKSHNVANLVGGAYRLELIKEEIAKCEVVCACCHRIRSHSRGDGLAPNKTPSIPNQ